jgi:hypothetical protein
MNRDQFIEFLNEYFEDISSDYSIQFSTYYRELTTTDILRRKYTQHYLYIRFLSGCRRYTFDYSLLLHDDIPRFENVIHKLSILVSFWLFMTIHQETEEICRFYSKIHLQGTSKYPSIELCLNKSGLDFDIVQRDFNPNHSRFSYRQFNGLSRFPLPEIEIDTGITPRTLSIENQDAQPSRNRHRPRHICSQYRTCSCEITPQYRSRISQEYRPRRNFVRMLSGNQTENTADREIEERRYERDTTRISQIINHQNKVYSVIINGIFIEPLRETPVETSVETLVESPEETPVETSVETLVENVEVEIEDDEEEEDEESLRERERERTRDTFEWFRFQGMLGSAIKIMSRGISQKDIQERMTEWLHSKEHPSDSDSESKSDDDDDDEEEDDDETVMSWSDAP